MERKKEEGRKEGRKEGKKERQQTTDNRKQEEKYQYEWGQDQLRTLHSPILSANVRSPFIP